jgi:exonuclease III
LENLKKEMQKNEVSILGVSEVRWKGQGEIRSGDYTVYYSGGERAEKGVAILVHKCVVRSVVKKMVYNDRIIAIKLQAEPINILMMQVYMPTSEHEDDEVEELCGVIEEILEDDGKGNTNTIIMGDWNSVGDEPYRNIVGPHGIGRKNHRNQMFINFLKKMD